MVPANEEVFVGAATSAIEQDETKLKREKLVTQGQPSAKRAAKLPAKKEAPQLPVQQFGVSPPISTAAPSARDVRESTVLQNVLRSQGAIPTSAQEEDGRFVLVTLEKVISKWVEGVGIQHGLNASQAEGAGAKLIPMGSFALLDGVVPGADIDLLVVVPYFVERSHFFEGGGLGGALMSCEGLTGLQSIADAFVPVIKFKLRGIPVDMLLTRLKLPTIPQSLAPDEERLMTRCIEDMDVHSLNGARVAAAILSLVPNKQNFRIALRAVKLWVMRRGLGCFAMGFPGGVAWAILMARVCQLYPNAAPSTLFSRFFTTWRHWKFGTPALPVLLCKEEVGGALSELPGRIAASDWSATSKRSRAMVMPVITPCKPRLCATHCVSACTLGVIKSELARASTILASAPAAAAFESVFERIDFFGMYPAFVAVCVTADSAAEHLYFRGWVKSRLRRLVQLLEAIAGVQALHPFPHALRLPPSVHESDDAAHSVSFFIGIGFSADAPAAGAALPSVDLRPAADEFAHVVAGWDQIPKLCPSGQMLVRLTLRHELPPKATSVAMQIDDDANEDTTNGMLEEERD